MFISVVDPRDKQRPFLSGDSHVRLRHDHALWLEESLDKILGISGRRIPFSMRSKFDSYKIALEAIEKSAEYPASVASNRLLVTTFDMGYQTGFDAKSNRVVTSATVVTRVTGEVVTAFPGTPWSGGHQVTP